MSLALRPYENLLRPAHEIWATVGWGTSALVTPVMGLATNAPSMPFLAMTAISAGMCAFRARQTYRLWRNKVNLCGHPFSLMRVSRLKQLVAENPDSVWLGAGWDWGPSHTQRLYEVRKRDLQTILPPKWFLKRIGMQHMLKAFVGLPWLHGLNQAEDHVYVPHEALEGHTLIFGTTGAGKAQPLDARVHTPTGWVRMGDIQPGDMVSIPDGGKAKVLGVFPQGEIPVFRITFSDGRSTEACGEHLWEIHHKHWSGKYKEGIPRAGCAKPRILTTKQLEAQIARNKGKFSVRLSGPVDTPEADVPLDPYILGAILGDGLIGKGDRMNFTSKDPEIVAEINRLLPDTMALVKRNVKTGIEYRFKIADGYQNAGWYKNTNRTKHVVHPLKEIIKDLGLSGHRSHEKFIPEIYKKGSILQRLAMIQGLMDTDGTIDQNRHGVFSTTSEQLAKDFQELIWSIGGIARISTKKPFYKNGAGEVAEGRLCYNVSIRIADIRLLVRASPLKVSRAKEKHQYSDALKLAVKKIEEIGRKESQCIYIDHPDHLYITDNYIVTHNTRMFETLIVQAIMRGETVVIVDPKGDKELKEIAQRACQMAERPDAFIEFNPAHPARSVRLDPLRNWNNVTELASRIAALMPSESGSDTFTQMAWKAVYVVAEALVYVDQMPTLAKLRRYIEGGPEKLMEQALRAYFQRNVPHWESLLAPLLQRARDGKLPSKVMGTPELIAYMTYYKNDIPEERRASELDGLLAMVEHNREHLGKILASLVPLLVMLTAGEIGKMLSPDTTDINDERAIFDTKKIVKGKHVLYLGLNSLSNSTVGSAIGSIVLADFAAVAGEIYNYGKKDKINLLVDEAVEVVNIPLIQILNKARGAGFVTYLAAQTLPDFIARMGDEARARQILGNCNNLISLRVKDRLTQDFIVETFGETEIQMVSRGMSSGVRPDDKNLDIDRNTNITKSINEQTVELFPPAMLGMLPNLEYIAFVSGGRLIKGRLPKLIEAIEG